VDESSRSLERKLGPLDAAAVIVSNVIGGGIFFVPVLVAQAIPNGTGILLVWLAGGALAFAGAMAYAELAALKPRAGGEYVYLREAYGPFAAFLSGWTSFVAGFSGAIAASSVAFAGYLGRFVPFAADTKPILSLPLPFVQLVLSRQSIVALLLIGGITFVHVRGLGPGRVFQNSLAGAKVFGLFVFLILGFTLGQGHAAQVFERATTEAHLAGVMSAFIPVMFTYSGWNAAAYVAEEIRAPERNVPRALALGTVTVIALYVGLNALYLYALGPTALGATMGTLSDAVAEKLFGPEVGGFVGAFTLVSIAASVSAMVLAGPRVYYAMARDGVFFASARRIHPRFRTPVVAIVSQAAWSAVLVLSGTLSELVSYTGFAIVLFSGAAVASLFVLRRRQNDERPFRAWGYPWAPGLFVLISGAMLVSEIARSPRTAIAGLAVIAAGAPVYWLVTRRLSGTSVRPNT
jgi:APA family basic amino acid/polyamine antiporter